jgi:hypothetical protein
VADQSTCWHPSNSSEHAVKSIQTRQDDTCFIAATIQAFETNSLVVEAARRTTISEGLTRPLDRTEVWLNRRCERFVAKLAVAGKCRFESCPSYCSIVAKLLFQIEQLARLSVVGEVVVARKR